MIIPELSARQDKMPYQVYQRTVFLGDSITDGNTYPMLVPDALRQAGLRRMVAINAGIGGDTAAQMAARLERDVLAHQPTLITLHAGANDVATHVSPAQYEQDVRGIIERIQQQHIPLILLTTVYLSTKAKPTTVEGYAHYDEILHRLAGEYGLRVAEVGARMREDAAAGRIQLAPDGHPGHQGQRMIARAVLDAMGYADVPVPERVHCTLQPGVITSWQLRPVAKDEAPLTEQAATAIVPDHTWVTLTLPQTTPITGDEHLWRDDFRQQGMATELKQWVSGESDKFIGVATIDSRSTRKVNFHTGAQLSKIWLNGKLIYENLWNHGWHTGRESVSAELQRGKNMVVIETGDHFFLSVNKDSYWK